VRIAGIDFGTKRIGIAVGDTTIRIASPLETYSRVNESADTAYFCRLVEREGIDRFVVGLPVHLDGRESQKSAEARQFGQWLQYATNIPVDYFDERFTTAEAEAILESGDLTKKKRDARRDQLAAQIMLTAYLEAGTKGETSPESIDD
jgi:putative Holliday junction resolvase